MSAVANVFSKVDAAHPGVNSSMLQESPVVLEVLGAMADNDTTTYTFPAAGDNGLPPRVVQVYRHTGGDKDQSSPAAAATYATSDGDTIVFEIDKDGTGNWVEYTHVLAGVSAGAATDDEIAASINADTAINKWVVAAPGLTTNLVTIAGVGPRAAVRYVGGTSVVQFPGAAAAGLSRTYVSQEVAVAASGTGFSYSYVAATRVLTVKNETGGTINRVQIIVQK